MSIIRPMIRPIMRPMIRPVFRGGGFTPLSLFANGEQGAWYDPSDLTTLYQDAAGTIPVAADGDPVGLMLDKSGNNYSAQQPVSASRGLYKTDGNLSWFQIDLVDDSLLAGIPDLGANATLAYATDGGAVIIEGRSYAGPLALPDRQNLYAVVYLNRALTVAERASLTNYLNAKAGLTTQALTYGPGPQTVIAGDMTTGFFGEVSDVELFDGNELASDLALTGGTAINRSGGWLKFIHNGVVKYISKKPYRHSVTWEQIYLQGLVYGTDDNGKAPYGTPTNQLTKVRKDGNDFVVRLMTGANADPFDDTDPRFYPSTDMYQLNIGGGSEWNELMYRIHELVPDAPPTNHEATTSGGPQVGANWANYTNADIVVGVGLGRAIWAQEQGTTSSADRAHRGDGGLAYFSRSAATLVHSNVGWRPVLQLIPVGG